MLPEKRHLVWLVLIVLVMTMILIWPSEAVGAKFYSFTVNNNGNEPDFALNGICETAPGNGICTLRAALDEINASGSGRVLIGPMTISVVQFYQGLTIHTGARVDIVGAGAGKTIIDGGGYAGVIVFTVEPKAVLNIRGVTLANGHAGWHGGGILNQGITTVISSVLDNHLASDSGMGGPAGTGAAIFNDVNATMTILNSTFSNNKARAAGGAIRNEGRLLVTNSTFTRNIAYNADGSAIFNLGQAVILNSTFSGNAGAGGTIANWDGRTTITSSTIVGYPPDNHGPGGALSNMKGSIVALNTIVSGSAPAANCQGVITSLGFNLSDDASCNLKKYGDRSSVDVRLGALAFYGGPTMTHRLLAGSPAIDGGFCIGPTDQRGYRRPVNLPFIRNVLNGCDVGAYEVQLGELP
jgi:hypothetical protein